MPSLRSKFCRFIIKFVVASKFDPNMPIDKARKTMEDFSRFLRLPRKTHVETVALGNLAADWVFFGDAPGDKAILYLHGGGYSLGSTRTHRELAAYVAKYSGARVLLPDYRLAPENPFPCALDDAVFAYHWLLGQGIACGNIAIAGDSAGGGLAIALAVALRDAGDPAPAAIACMSPWTDLAVTGDSIATNAAVDPVLNAASIKRMAAAYIGQADARLPLISPLYAYFSGLSPLLIHVGTDEMLLDDSKRIAEKARRAGVDVTLKIYDRMWHVFHLNVRAMPEAKKAVKAFGAFIREHCGG